MQKSPAALLLAVFAATIFIACSGPARAPWPIEDPPAPPLHLKAKSEIEPKAALPMPQVKPSFAWPENLRLEAAATIEHRQGSELWLDRRATTKYVRTVTVTPTSVGPIINLGDVDLQQNEGSGFITREMAREVALDGSLAFRVKNDGHFNRVAEVDDTIAAAKELLALHGVDASYIQEPLADFTEAEVAERAKSTWSAWVENALGLVGSPTAGWCGKTKPPPLFIETDKSATACLALTAGSQCLIDGETSACFLVEYGLELDQDPVASAEEPTAEPAPPAEAPEASEGETPTEEKPLPPPTVKHESRARVMLSMESLLPVKVEVWRFTDVVEPRKEGYDARTWKVRHSLTRFRKVEGPPVGSARTKLEASCKKGTAEDCMELGIMIGTGKDGPPDLAGARQWVDQACKLEHQEACEFLEVMADVPGDDAPAEGESLAPAEPTPTPTPTTP